MRRLACIVLLLALVAIIAGCQTMARDGDQSTQQYSRIAELNRRMLVEDLETFWLLNRPSRLTSWHVYDK